MVSESQIFQMPNADKLTLQIYTAEHTNVHIIADHFDLPSRIWTTSIQLRVYSKDSFTFRRFLGLYLKRSTNLHTDSRS